MHPATPPIFITFKRFAYDLVMNWYLTPNAPSVITKPFITTPAHPMLTIPAISIGKFTKNHLFSTAKPCIIDNRSYLSQELILDTIWTKSL